MRIALTRPVSRSISECELTHIPRNAIDFSLAQAQHHAYENMLETLGCRVQRLPSAPELPDAVFLEDVAVVLDELAIIGWPGAASRRAEIPGVAEALEPHRKLEVIHPPGTLDGGDVLRIGDDLYVGSSGRTNPEGIEQLREITTAYGYSVKPIEVQGCLHLKSALTAVGEEVLLINPRWVEPTLFAGLEWIPVVEEEPHAANALLIDSEVIYPASFPLTEARLFEHGVSLRTVDISELQKAEGGVTCCSVIFEL